MNVELSKYISEESHYRFLRSGLQPQNHTLNRMAGNGAMIDISANDGDPRSIVISYGPMPEGSDAIMEAGDTYEELIGEIGPAVEDGRRFRL